MPSGYGGIQFWTDGWTGQIRVEQGGNMSTFLPDPTSSALAVVDGLVTVAKSAIHSSFSWAVTSAGYLSITADVAFVTTMTGTTNDKLGFTSSSYGAATTRTAETVAPGGFYPYGDDDGVFFSLDVRAPTESGFLGYDRAYWMQTPATNIKSPILSISVLRAKALDFAAAAQDLGSPAKLDLYYSSNRASFYVGQISTSEQSAFSGWTDFTIEVVS